MQYTSKDFYFNKKLKKYLKTKKQEAFASCFLFLSFKRLSF